jgi:microcystin-dependent protein
MSDNFLGEIRMFCGNFAPTRWALCGGQLLSINQNQALFALFGTTYGGNGIQNFALPNLLGRIPNGQGQGTGLSNYVLGQQAGVEAVTILQTNLPSHSHTFNASQDPATSQTVGSTVIPAKPNTSGNKFFTVVGSKQPLGEHLSAGSCGLTGGSQPHSNLMPTLCVTFIIALQGIFPSRT